VTEETVRRDRPGRPRLHPEGAGKRARPARAWLPSLPAAAVRRQQVRFRRAGRKVTGGAPDWRALVTWLACWKRN